MDEQKWKQAYEEILSQGEAEGFLSESQDGRDRRTRPRFKLKTGHVWIKVHPKFSVTDVSTSGIAVFSDYFFEAGQVLSIAMGKALSIEARVIDCSLVVSDPDFLEIKYLVRCRFEDENTGMQLLVMLKETDGLEMEISGVARMPDE